MCHKSFVENEQIEKCIENGMPRKIIKTIKSTMRKRAANEQINKEQQQQQNTKSEISINNSNETQQINPKEPEVFVSKCPFGHGKLTTPATQFLFSPLKPQPTNTTPKTTASSMNKEFDFPNNNNITNNNLYERFPQILQLSTTLTTTALTADNNDNAISNLSGHFDDDNKNLLLATKKIVYHDDDDILAKSTQISREFVYKMQQTIRRLQSSKIYTVLTKTTQPAHLVAMGIVTIVLLTLWPELIDKNSNDDSNDQHLANRQPQTSSTLPTQEMSAKRNNMVAVIAYLGSFALHFGAQIWMTFVSGLSLFFSLPRHIFGQCQQILFPKYFAMNAALSITMLIIYGKYFISTWTLAKSVQFGSLALTGTIELLVRLYLAPPLLRLMHEKYKIEGAIGSGQEIGSLVQGDLIKCPHYQRIHKAFRRLHMMVAIGNIITMAGSCLQLYNIASQLQISIVY